MNLRNVFATRNVTKLVCCDASAQGAGSIICNEIHVAHKLWTKQEAQKSSTWRELNTIRFAINSFLPMLSGSQLKVFSDSQSATRIVEIESMKSDLQDIALDIFTICLRNNIRLEVDWIPRTLNDQADFNSRLIDTDDWELSSQFFNELNSLWGPLSIDCFANYYNAKLTRFYSRF